MANNPTRDVAAPAPSRGWLDSARRSSWVRLPVFFAVLLAADIGAQFGRAFAIHHAPSDSADWASLASTLLLVAALMGIYVGLVRSLERRTTHELAPRPLQGIVGIALGLALFSSVFGLLHLIGVAQWQGLSTGFDAVPMLSAALLAAVGEELAFRGGVFRILEESFGTATALAISAALFGLLHALNTGATVLSTVAIALEAGVLLGAAYALTRNLWFPMGLHLGWNFTEGGIFGVSVSGGSAIKGFFSVSLAGRPVLTGGKFGPEASVIAIVVCLALAVALLVLTVRNGRWLTMRRSAARSTA